MKLGHAEPLPGEVLPADLAVPDQDRGRVLDDPPEPLRAERHPRHQSVHDEDGRGAQEAAAQRVVISDERVLHDVADDEEDDQVEGRHLPDLALSNEAERRQQEDVDDDRPDDLLDERDIRNPEVHGDPPPRRWTRGDASPSYGTPSRTRK